MAFHAQPGEQYTIRRKVLKLFGASFHIYAPDGSVIGFCKQKAFKLKEDIRIYTDESMSTELLVIRARSIIDFSATYDVLMPSGESLGSFRRAGLASTFVRDQWQAFDPAGRQIAELAEVGSFLAFARRFIDLIALLSPQVFNLTTTDGREIASFRTHFNLFVYRLSISIKADDNQLDDLMILAAGCLIAAIEGRQGS
jgi:uncharacterized protein YxjI